MPKKKISVPAMVPQYADDGALQKDVVSLLETARRMSARTVNALMTATKNRSQFNMRSCRWMWSGLIAASLVIGVAIYFVDTVMKNREAAMQTVCRGRLGQLMLALHNYHDTYGSFPPASIADADGKPMHSWRVLVLPFLDGLDVYRKYRFDEPWNSPHNAALAKLVPGSIFRCPDSPDLSDTTLTDYVVIVGPDTVFPHQRTTTLSDFHDGTENTILVAEIARSDIHWMEPRDLSTDQMSFQVNDPQRPSVSSLHPLGPGVIFADSIGAYRLGPSIRPATLKALTTINGSESVSKDALVPKDHCRQLAE